ncbi:hypothetical protein GCM10010195_50310 [Kitasatospora griseola]|nr:hypothetical protein GCM10010195_50310 [Kitasatospora griseola]
MQQQAGVGPVHGGGGTLFSEPVLVVNQKVKLIELTNEYAVFGEVVEPAFGAFDSLPLRGGRVR